MPHHTDHFASAEGFGVGFVFFVFEAAQTVCVSVRETEMDGFCGQMCMKSGANGVRSKAAGRGQAVG